MDGHEYVTGRLIQDTLAEYRATAARERLYREHRAPRAPLRFTVGSALVRLGSRIVGADAATRLNTSYRRA